MTEYLRVRNLTRYQHYRDRRPPWIKLHVDMLDDDDLAELPTPSRLVACLILLVAANRDNKIPNDPAWLATELRISRPDAKRALADLLAATYLEPASRSASTNASNRASKTASTNASNPASKTASPRARPRARGEAEAYREETDRPSVRSTQTPRATASNGRADGRNLTHLTQTATPQPIP